MTDPTVTPAAAPDTLFVEPFGGMAGDMFLAALLDLGDPRFVPADLEALAAELVPGEAEITVEEVRRASLRARLVGVRTPESVDPPHRHLADLLEILGRAPLGDRARARATGALRRIAEAEAEVHGRGVEEVHFHEVGAVDTLVDVAGAALALERLGVARVVATPPLVGSGTVECAHGTMPVPAPGTLGILAGLPFLAGGEGERTTPTGAALLAEFADAFLAGGEPFAFRPARVGYGAGRRDPASGPPNLVRVSLGSPGELAGEAAGEAGPEVLALAVNLDDTTGEEVGFLLAELRAAGALEAWSEAVQMKKDRPGQVLHALCRPELRAALERIVFDHAPTLGVRWTRHHRTECAREELKVELDGGTVRVKRRIRPHDATVGPLDLSPEFDDLARLSRATGRPLRELEARAIARARAALGLPGDGPGTGDSGGR